MDNAAIGKLNDLQGIYIAPEHGAGFLVDSVFTPEQVQIFARAVIDPIPMILHCPKCGTQHIDAPMTDAQYTERLHESSWWELGGDKPQRWTNPPHRSHLCHNCGHIWRPADVSTTGVEKIETRGKNDSPTVSPHYAYRDAQRLRKLINSCGYVQNSSEVEVRLSQDDATRECGIKVGRDDTIWAESFRTAIDKLPEPE